MGAPIVFRIALPGQEELAVALNRFADNIASFEHFWNDYFSAAWFRHVDTHYTTQGGSTGPAWAALTQAYDAWKQKHWPGLPIGVLTGATRESLTFPNDPNGIWEPTPTSLRVGSRVPWARYQQLGTRKMAARPPLRIDETFLLTIGKLLQEYGVKSAKDAGVNAG